MVRVAGRLRMVRALPGLLILASISAQPAFAGMARKVLAEDFSSVL
jgi:hypothetical protein